MTAPIAELGPLGRLAGMRHLVVGIDLSTLRASAGILAPGAGGFLAPSKRSMVRTPVLSWSTRTLTTHEHLAYRNVLAVDALVYWLREIEADHGVPTRLALEVPLAGGKTPLPSFWMVGALYVAIGQVWGSRVPVREWNPPQWKKRATGVGSTRVGQTAAQRRKHEKARLMVWARDVMGYTGGLEDEVDGIGVAVAEALAAAGA